MRNVESLAYKISQARNVAGQYRELTKREKLRIISQKLRKEVYKLALATILAQFLFVGAWYLIATKTNILGIFENKTVFISNVYAKEKEIEVKQPETNHEIVERIAKEQGFGDIELLNRIIKCESNWDNYAKNTISSARGLFQIMDMHGLSEMERYNVETSTKWAINEIKKNGTKAWNASKECWNK